MITRTKRYVASTVFAISSVALATAFAANGADNAKNSADASASPQYITVKNSKGDKLPDRMVQEFKQEKLNVQFRYVKGKLAGIRLLNTSKAPLEVNLQGHNYLLGANDYVVVNPPSVETINISHKPAAFKTTIGHLLPNRFNQHHFYQLSAKNTDNRVTQSESSEHTIHDAGEHTANQNSVGSDNTNSQ